MEVVRLYLFGLPRIEVHGAPVKIERRKALALAAYLAMSTQRHSRDHVTALLWPDLSHEQSRTALRTVLHTLTSAINSEWIQADRMMLALKREAVWVDTRHLLALLAECETHDHSPDVICNACAPLLNNAAALYQGDFMAGFTLADSVDFDDWQAIQREWLRREYADVLRRLTLYHANAQRFEQAIATAQRWVATDPLHEQAQRQLMQLYAANGQRSEALRQYKQLTEMLEAELAAVPEAETTALYSSILGGGSSSSLSAPAASASINVLPPFPALVIGREAALTEMKRHLGIGGEMRHITVIQGWPGVGKSTTVALLAHDPQIAEQFPDGVLWASLGETPSIVGALTTWSDALHLTEPDRVRQTDEISAQLTAVLRDKRVLLIVDDVWQVEHAGPFRVGGQHSALIITSRLNDVATALAPTALDLFRLPVLTDDAGLELLAKLTPETVTDHPNEARQLVADLEGLPLAIHVAGRLLQSEARLGWGIRELLTELRDGAKLLEAAAPSDMIGTQKMLPSVAALLKRSTDRLDAETRHRFAHLGLFVPKPATFDLEAMAVAWDVRDARPTARLLVNRGLLEPVTGGRFQMHALLVLHARSLLSEVAP